ncbi:MAG: polysaccharide deacetylase family protein [Deltaproteobacteria bacterium]|nr:polysaccharide deacetylase family protein [Deltaproteobacteria bacterium]
MTSDFLYNRIHLLTGNKLNIDPSDPPISIPQKYYLLLGNKQKKQVFLSEVVNAVHSILSRKEEYGDATLDKWGRFDHDKSFLVQNGLDQSPIIDELILYILNQLDLKTRSIWPEGKKFAVCLTHDVDAIDGLSYLWLRRMNWYWRWVSARLGNNQQEADKWISTLKKWVQFRKLNFDPMDSFDQIQELEDSHGFRSTFFFMSLCHGLSREGRRYSVKNPRVAEVSKKLLEGGWEIGLHADYHDPLSLSSLKKQRQRLEDVIQKEISGCRHHYLRVRFPDSWEIYAQAGFNYSSNMGWGSGFQGFRAGTCLPYQPIREHSLLEVPFQLMDTNPIADIESYMNMFNQYLELTKSVGGCLVLDFHQEHFREEAASGVGKVYKNILDTIARDQDVVVLTMNEVCKTMKQIGKLA